MNLDINARALLNSLKEGILITDAQSRICFGNKAYLEFLGKDLAEIEGKHLKELRPGAVLPDVIRHGKPMLHAPRMEQGETYFCNMYPVFLDGEVIGGVSVVTFISDAHNFKEELEAYERKKRQILRTIASNQPRYTFDSIVSIAPASMRAKELAQKIAETDTTVLLEGESGTGKELFAQAVHNASERKHSIFIAINCANFNENTLESELFGYVEGAFTGAKKGGKIGLFEAANGGTLFLDEVSEMELSLQAKVLRAIQEQTVRPVGSTEETKVDVRIICACNADLRQCVEAGTFRKDLYYRLSSFPVVVPPLRERKEDIPLLTEFMLTEMSQKLKRPLSIEASAMACLQEYHWPGNVRELRNVIEFSALLSEQGTIIKESLPEHVTRSGRADELMKLSEQVKEFEKREIMRLLSINGSDLKGKRITAKQLGISLASLYNKTKREQF